MVIYIFCIGSVLGWFLEITYKIVANQDTSTAGMSKGPFCITYGFATVILYLFISNISSNIIVTFFCSMIFLTLIELISGIILDKILKISLWDYKGLKLYINKYICGEFMLLWGILGVIYIKFFQPIIIQFLTNIDTKIANVLCYLFLLYMALDYILTVVNCLKNNRSKITSL